MKQLLVKDLMTTTVHTLEAQSDLTTLYDLMDSEHIRHLPVVDDEGNLVGLVTHRDLLRSALSNNSDVPVSMQRDVFRTVRIEEIMSTTVETTEPDVPLHEAAQVMLENKFGCLPVVEGTHLVGILTEADFVRYLSESVAGG